MVDQTIDTLAQIRVQSKVTWVLQLVEYSSDSSRTCSKKVTTKSADNQSVQIHFHMFCVHCLWEIRVLISRSSEGSSLIFVTCRRGQVTIPWLKWLTDALASEPTLQIWPRGFSTKPGRVQSTIDQSRGLRGQLVVFAWEQMQLWGKGCRPLAHCVPMLWCLGVPALMLTM